MPAKQKSSRTRRPCCRFRPSRPEASSEIDPAPGSEPKKGGDGRKYTEGNGCEMVAGDEGTRERVPSDFMQVPKQQRRSGTSTINPRNGHVSALHEHVSNRPCWAHASARVARAKARARHVRHG
ncbi:hypothetical protein FGB62_289g06 [Gracilaria domingensis]|nr:hypothetical protein FGB62_289g06 [Gracilaria domingensis]